MLVFHHTRHEMTRALALPRTLWPGSVPAVWGAAAALLVLAPWFSLSPFAADYDAQRLLEIAAWTLLATAVTAVHSVRGAWIVTWLQLPRWVQASASAFLLLGLASAALAARPVYAFAEVASFGMIGVSAVAAAAVGREGTRSGMALVAVLTLGSYAAVVLTLQAGDLLDGGGELWPAKHLGYGHVRHFNQIQAWTLPVLWALSASTTGRESRARLFGLRAVCAANVTLVIASNGRGIVLALVVGLLIAAATITSGRKALIREVAVSVGAGAALWVAFFSGASTVLDRIDAGSNGRVELWTSALRMVEARPWLGVGPMHYSYYPSEFAAHPHNLALQIAAEWGLPAALLATTLGLAAGTRWLRHTRRVAPNKALWTAGLTIAFVASFTNAMVDGFLIAPMSQIVAALGAGALLAEVLPANRQAASSPLRFVCLAVVVLPSLAVLLAVVVSDSPRLWRAHYDLRFAHVGTSDTPRFWLCGRIAGRIPEDNAQFWPDTFTGALRR